MPSWLKNSVLWSTSAAITLGISYGAVCWLLGVRWSADEFDGVRAVKGELRQALAFEQGGHVSADQIERFARAAGISAGELTAASTANAAFVPLEKVIELNPYPRLLRSPPYYPYWISLGYRANDDRYHQVTWYGGEADTTPSMLVRKVRRRQTGWGDYYVRYTIGLSRELEPQPEIISTRTGEVTRWRPPAVDPDVEFISWETYGGGSYDGFEEIGFTLLGTVLLTPILALGTARAVSRWKRRTPPHKPLQPTSGPGASGNSKQT